MKNCCFLKITFGNGEMTISPLDYLWMHCDGTPAHPRHRHEATPESRNAVFFVSTKWLQSMIKPSTAVRVPRYAPRSFPKNQNFEKSRFSKFSKTSKCCLFFKISDFENSQKIRTLGAHRGTCTAVDGFLMFGQWNIIYFEKFCISYEKISNFVFFIQKLNSG